MVAPMVLVPELRPGDVVIMDDLGSHKGAGVRVAIKAASASLRYLPPYRLDFNPIENAFAKLKAMFRKAVERTLEALWSTVVSMIETFAPRVRQPFCRRRVRCRSIGKCSSVIFHNCIKYLLEAY